MESDLDVDGDADFVTSELVPADYGAVMGLSPALGRWFADDAEPVAVISYAIWQRRFNLSPDVLGRRIGSQSQVYTIIGVAPRAFTGVLAPMRTDLWVPVRTRASLFEQLEDRRQTWGGLLLFGRLRAGETTANASVELNAIDAQLTAEHGRSEAVQSPIIAEHARGLPDPGMRRRVGTFSALMAAVVALVLLIACVNVGNLLLVRGALRQREFAVRRALGASRTRLVQQLLAESLVLAVGGGLCGVILAGWTNRLLEWSVPSIVAGFGLQLDLPLDWRVLIFATVVALATTVLCGLVPAWRTSQARALVAFKSEIGAGAPRRRPVGLIAQVVMSLVLLFVAASALQALVRLQAADPGFDVATRLYAYTFLSSPPSAGDGRREFYARALEQLRALPGMQKAAFTSSLLTPIDRDCVSRPAGARIPVSTSDVETGYFDISGIALVAGREFTVADQTTDVSAVVLNESLARWISPDGSAVGQRLMVGCDTAQPAVVVGIVRESGLMALVEPGQPRLYRPFAPQSARGFASSVMQTSGDAAGLVEPVRRALLALGQGMRVYTVAPLSTHVEQRYAPLRWLADVLTLFGLVALLLAAVGLYGVIAYRVALRTQEIGVRMALGARRTDVFREVLLYGLAIVLVGVVIGEILTAALTRAAGSLQPGFAPAGVDTHIGVALIWFAVAILACYLPAARAARVDPIVALRHE
jgi:predicted permease